MTALLPDLAELAKLTIVSFQDDKFTKAVSTWRALFNPTELKFGRKITWNVAPAAGTSVPTVTFGHGDPAEVSVELFFDGTGVVPGTQTVRERVEELLDLMTLRGDTHQPYYAQLHWGAFTFRGVMKSGDVTYTLFDRAGQPLRAKVTAVFGEVIAPEHREACEAKASPDLRQTWLVSDGDTIHAIAERVYGAPEHWRGIAAANDLVNPRSLSPGTVLVLPPKVP